MSKVFEEEYRQLAENDLPNLWDRIEAGLSPRTVTAPSCSGTAVKPVPSDEAQPVHLNTETAPFHSDTAVKPMAPHTEDKLLPSGEAAPSAPKHGIIPHFRRRPGRYAGLIAACLCAVVIIPAAINAGRNNGRQFSAEAPAAEEAAAPMAEAAAEEETAAAEEAVPVAEEDAVPAAEEAPAPVAEEAAAAAEESWPASEEAAAPEAPAAGMSDEADGAVPDTDTNSIDTEVSNSGNATLGTSPDHARVSDGTAPAGEVSQEEVPVEAAPPANQQPAGSQTEENLIQNKFAAGTVIKAVSFKVTAADETDGTVIYRAAVTEEAGGLLAADEEITFIKKAGIKTDITVGKRYQADLYYCEGKDYLFTADEVRIK